jgi:hypothetical protein
MVPLKIFTLCRWRLRASSSDKNRAGQKQDLAILMYHVLFLRPDLFPYTGSAHLPCV